MSNINQLLQLLMCANESWLMYDRVVNKANNNPAITSKQLADSSKAKASKQ